MNLGEFIRASILLQNGQKIDLGDINSFETSETITKEKEKPKFPKPFEIKQKLDEFVIGQDDAKTILSVVAYNHFKRINMDNKDTEIQKSNVLLIGSSGCGKTLLVETLAKVLDVPFVIADATDFSPTGIVGRSTNDIIRDLINKANGDEDKAERGIVFIDEIDKIASSGNTLIHRDGVLSSEVQANFLKFIEGKEAI
jgi:ATP-dependent Clp protease ATP-binding subunit ClpX